MTSIPEGASRPMIKPMTVALFLVGILALSYYLPGGGLLGAALALATDLRRSKRVLLLLFAVAALLALVPLVTFLGLGIPPVAVVHEGVDA
jgi:hypothetical protein